MTTATTPEPGQRYLVEAVAEEVRGDIRLRLITPDGHLSPNCPRADAVVWHPADVPPQPPVLATNTTVRLFDENRPFAVASWWTEPDGLGRMVRLIPLADVPGPDDTTPTPDVCPDCGGSGVEEWDGTGYPRCMGCGGVGKPYAGEDDMEVVPELDDLREQLAETRLDRDLSRRERDEARAEIERLRSAPAAGEGAALIAATNVPVHIGRHRHRWTTWSGPYATEDAAGRQGADQQERRCIRCNLRQRMDVQEVSRA